MAQAFQDSRVFNNPVVGDLIFHDYATVNSGSHGRCGINQVGGDEFFHGFTSARVPGQVNELFLM
jgi:hypothetical protein